MKNSKTSLTLIAVSTIFLLGSSVEKSKHGNIKELIRKQKYKDAIAETDRLLKNNPKDEAALILQADALLRSGQAKDAVTVLNQVLRINPNSAEAYFDRMKIYYAAQAYKKALPDAIKVVQLKPKWAEAHSSLGVLKFYASNDFEGGVNELTEAIRLQPKFASSWQSRGALYFKLGHLSRARSDLDKALQLDPNDPDALNNRGRVLHDLKLYQLAIQDYDRAIKLAPNDGDPLNNKGLALTRLGQDKEALIWYTKAIEKDSADASSYSNRGAANLRLKNYKQAEMDLRKAIRLDPKHASSHNNLAALYQLRGQTELANSEMDKAIELAPDDKVARRNRGMMLAKSGALEESLMDLSTAKNSARPVSDKGLSRSEFEEVVKTNTRLLTLDPNDKDAHYNRGFAYFCMGGMKAALLDLDSFVITSGADSRSAINAAVLSCLAHRQLGHTLTEARRPLERVLRNSGTKLQEYWGWSLASYLNGSAPKSKVEALTLTKTTKTRLKCYLGIDSSLLGHKRDAMAYFDWIRDFGDRDIDEYDLAMSWRSRILN